MQIGLCGLGKMGAAIGGRLLDGGAALRVWNRDLSKAAPLVARGARQASTPAEVAADGDVVITMLLDDAALESVYLGQHGLFGGDIQGKLFIDMSTVRPATQMVLAKGAGAKGAGFVECPVGGTVGPAREGKLLGLAGGSSADVARARPILERLCRRLEHVGEVGAGARMKLAVNLPLMVYWQALGEALALAAPLNLPPERLIDILSDTSGTPVAMKGRGPDIARLLAGQAIGPAAFDVGAARKDLDLMLGAAAELGAALPATAAARASFALAEGQGLGGSDAVNVPVQIARAGRSS